MSYIEKEKLIKADIASIENRVRHAFNQGYDLGFRDGKNKQSNCSEISKNSPTETLISLDVYKQVAWERDIAIQQLHELGYEFGQKIEPTTKNDKIDCQHTDCNNCVNHKYCDYEPTTKNDLGVDAVSRADARSLICNTDIKHHMFGMSRKVFKDLYNGMDELPSVAPQEPRKGHWVPYLKEGLTVKCSECKSRYTLGYNFCPNCGADMREVVE